MGLYGNKLAYVSESVALHNDQVFFESLDIVTEGMNIKDIKDKLHELIQRFIAFIKKCTQRIKDITSKNKDKIDEKKEELSKEEESNNKEPKKAEKPKKPFVPSTVTYRKCTNNDEILGAFSDISQLVIKLISDINLKNKYDDIDIYMEKIEKIKEISDNADTKYFEDVELEINSMDDYRSAYNEIEEYNNKLYKIVQPENAANTQITMQIIKAITKLDGDIKIMKDDEDCKELSKKITSLLSMMSKLQQYLMNLSDCVLSAESTNSACSIDLMLKYKFC